MSNDTEIKQKIMEYEKRLKILENEIGVEPTASIEFPQYRVLPEEVQLALLVIQRHQYKIMLTYKEINNAN